jgi:uncharacterized protein (TIGR02449 family)
MESELHALEERIRQAVDLCKRLRSENVELRQRVAQLESEGRRLQGKLDVAVEQVEALLGKIPENTA